MSTREGGGPNGTGLRDAGYSANSLYQYTQRDVPGAADIMGIAHAGATVAVNLYSGAYRKGEYFWHAISANNTSAPVWQEVSVVAALTGTNQTNAGHLFLPRTPEVFAHDADGNLTNDGRFAYTWDAENRLLQVESYGSAPTASKRRVSYAYDAQSRLVRRTVEEGSSGNYVVASDQKYVWNDWLCLADLNATNNNVERSYLWGLDLSGSMQGAGGIGGLIAISDQPSSETHFVSYDGNGNVAALVSAADSSVTARYEYDPFGRTIRATGLMAAKNPMRFSTKRFDEAADLAYYGYRFYNLTTGRWLNRDPIGETSAGNLYGLLANLPVSGVDAFGLCKVCSSGVRYRVDIARLDSFQVVPPGQTGPYQAAANNLAGGLSFAYGIQGYPGIQTTIPTSSGPFSGVNPGNSWLPNEQRQAFQGDLHSVNFLFFADWEIDESDGVPCRLTMSEEGTVIRHYTDSSPDSTFRLHQDEHDISPTKSDRKPPLNGCCPKTLIFADAPGGYVLRAGGGGRGFGFDQTVNIVLKLYGSGVQPISTVSIAISMSVASDGTINSIHP